MSTEPTPTVTDALVERIARATHAHNNSGVDAPNSPLTWETEQPYMRNWHRAMAVAALNALLEEDR